jgi:hypothetical protein
MHKILSTTLLLALSSVSLNAVSDQDREAMCHKGQNFDFVTPSVQAHLNHGDTKGTCGGEAGPGDMDGMTVVLIMRCKAGDFISISASFDYASIQPVEPTTCPEALSSALAAGFKLRSITSGSAGEGESLQMYTDYLLLGEEPEED